MNQLDHLLEGVTNNENLHNSGTRLMHNIVAALNGSVDNPDATRALAGSIERNARVLVDAILANTPVVVGTHPAPQLPEAVPGSPVVDPTGKPAVDAQGRAIVHNAAGEMVVVDGDGHEVLVDSAGNPIETLTGKHGDGKKSKGKDDK